MSYAGFDIVGLGYTNNTGPTLSHQIVAEFNSDDYWFGLLGLGFQPTNFSDYGNPQASYSDSLSSNDTISSRSWSYTAGAYYRLKSVFGSLIFGGYDASRFTPNDVVFTMTGDNLRDIVLYVVSITSTTAKGNTTLMSTPEKVFIDSTVVDFWLPVSVCQAFEKAFGLQLDQKTGRYLLNSSTHDRLKSDNPNVTFTLADQATGGHTIDIVLPYASFDLNLSAPFVNKTTMYFPLRQGQNDSMYTLGRAFLQEAYVTADYNTRTFNVSQCIFDPNSKGAQVIAIPSDMPVPISGGNSSGNGAAGGGGGGGSGHAGSKELSGGAIAGIVIGSVILLIIIGGIFFCCYSGMWCFGGRRKEEKRAPTPIHEIDSGKRIDPNASAYTAQASAFTSEVPGNDAKVEIAGNPIMHPQELEADVPMAAYANHIYHRSNDSSEDTTVVSSVSQSPEGNAANVHGSRRAPRNGSESDSAEGTMVSPRSPTQRGMRNITLSSPTDTHATWTP
jgi:Eukaryotic aspartyl protease